MKARGPGWPWGKTRHPKTPAVAYYIEEWMQGLVGDSDGKPKWIDDTNHRPDQKGDHLQWGAEVKGCIGGREPHSFPENHQDIHPLQEETVDGQSECSSQHSTQTRVSRESSQLGWTGRGFMIKVNLPTFKDKKAKDTVTYCSWWWDVSVFCHFGWDDCHLLPYVFRSLQGLPGDLARSLGEVATLDNVLQTLDEHYGVIMTFDALSKELYSLKQGMGENMAEFGVCLSQQVQIL